MASKAASFADVCTVCLETRPLKIVGRCKHRFCVECLMTTLGSQKGDVFPCPTCKVDCPRPWDGVKGMVDFTGKDVAVVDTVVEIGQKGGVNMVKKHTGRGKAGAESQPNEGSIAGNRKKRDGNVASITMDVKCTICHHKKKEVQAVNMCVKCGNLHICEECTKVHARNKATQGHVVVRFRSQPEQEKAMCEEHDSALNSYCHDCGKAVCMVCVMLVHGEHTVEKLDDVVDAGIETLGVILEEREREMRKLQGLKCELTVLQAETADLHVDKQDILISEIEDHAQKCIDQVVKWKEGLKGKVKMCFSIVQDIPVDLKKVSDVIEKLQKPIGSAAKLLATTDRRQINLNELITLQQDLKATTELGGDLQRSGHLHQLRVLHDDVDDFSFIPDVINTSFGMVDRTEAQPVLMGEFPVEIFKQTISAASEDMFIPCVANLGKMFAVASPTRFDEPSVAIDIYEFPGKWKCRLQDHVSPLYDMSSTPDGKLAVLSDATGGTGCSIKLFDPDTGYISCTRDIDIVEPLSLGVTIRHQYVILGGDKQGRKVITVVDKEGVVECSRAIDEDFFVQPSSEDMEDIPHEDVVGQFSHLGMENTSDEDDVGTLSPLDMDDTSDEDYETPLYSLDMEDVVHHVHVGPLRPLDMKDIPYEDDVGPPKRITCGGMYVFVLGDNQYAVYEIYDGEIQLRKTYDYGIGFSPEYLTLTDISADIWGDHVLSRRFADELLLEKWVVDQGNILQGWEPGNVEGDFIEARISAQDGYIVLSCGRTIQVFKDLQSWGVTV